ncbi:hypothetical protein AAHE18_18G231200 [Arachis hypogaea]
MFIVVPRMRWLIIRLLCHLHSFRLPPTVLHSFRQTLIKLLVVVPRMRWLIIRLQLGLKLRLKWLMTTDVTSSPYPNQAEAEAEAVDYHPHCGRRQTAPPLSSSTYVNSLDSFLL